MNNAMSDAVTSRADAPGWRYLGCECCGRVTALPPSALAKNPPADSPAAHCKRCGEPLYDHKPQSLQRTWAYLSAALLMYLPANVLPIMSTTQAFRAAPHTVLGGIAELWHDGAWILAAVVFLASIAVPVMKIGALALLAFSVRHAPQWRRLERAKVYGLIEAVGHWSMLDVYVVVLLAGMVRFGGVASAAPGPGLLAFAAVVIFTMLATHSFDPRLIWKDPE